MLGGGAQLKCPGPDRSAPILIVVWKPRRDMAAPWRRKLLSMSRPASACIGLPLIGALHGGGLDDPGVAEQGIQICVAGLASTSFMQENGAFGKPCYSKSLLNLC